MARTGKIARLPLAVREELNLRLLDNENGQDILAWLNDLDVTKEVITPRRLSAFDLLANIELS